LLDTGSERGVEVELSVGVPGEDGVVNSGEDGGHALGGRRRRGEEGKLLAALLEGAVGRYSRAMLEVTESTLAGWPQAVPFQLVPQMYSIALSVLLRCVFGVQGAEQRELRGLVLGWVSCTLSPRIFITGMLFGAKWLRGVLDRGVARVRSDRGRPLLFARQAEAKAALFRALEKKIDRCRAEPEPGDHVLGLLVGASYDDGSPMEDADILDQLITLLVGGHETTANVMAWVLAHVLRRPLVLARIRAEIEEHFGDAEIDATRAVKLTYLSACIRESMRLTPISPGPIRYLTEDLELPGVRVPAGSAVWGSMYLSQRRPEAWNEPLEFRPERFLEASTRPSSQYYPFGGGARRCLGAVFAEHEMRIVLAAILRRYDLRLLSMTPPRGIFTGLAIGPEGGVPVRARPLQAVPSPQ